ncbi:MAG: hypothetical protein KIT31_22845 [Deltaproteobacteria bacterium]|nr:hypothetical protein [Deltaproteobacteria bacterium]
MLRIATLVVALAVSSVALAAPDPKAVLQRERVTAAQKVYTAGVSRLAAGATSAEVVCSWSVRWLDAELAAGTPAKQAFPDHLSRMEKLETAMTKARDAGTVTSTEADVATYFRIEAALWATNGSKI